VASAVALLAVVTGAVAAFAGAAPALAAATSATAGIAPAFTAAPAIATAAPRDGTPAPGRTGKVTGTAPLTVRSQWQRCPAAGPCADIPGAVATDYTPTAADVGATLRLAVEAANAAGTARALSAATTAVAPAAPASTAAPTVEGVLVAGATLTARPGTWTGTTPMAFAYTWRRCPTDVCTTITGATGATYTATGADLGASLQLTVTATNAARSATATSARSAPVTGAPEFRTAPTLASRDTRDGSVVVGRAGTVAGNLATTVTYAWLRCDTAGGTCTAIPGAAALEYTASAADVGATLRLQARAEWAGRATLARTAPSAVVSALRPTAVRVPTITGTPVDGATLAAGSGTWTGTADLAFTYKWRRCDPVTCRTIVGATAERYTLGPADLGSAVDVVVTATNRAGATPATSARSTAVTARPPAATGGIVVAGTPQVGLALEAAPAAFTGTAPLAVGRQWLRCDGDGLDCTPVAGATGPAHTLAAEDAGRRLRVAVTATNAAGTATVTSGPSGVVAARTAAVFADRFDRADGLMTNSVSESARPGQAGWSADWQATSGSWFVRDGAAWSGVPDGLVPDRRSATSTGSAILRIRTRAATHGDVAVSARFRLDAFTTTALTPTQDWDGAHLWLRYHSEEELYAVSVARRDGTVVIRKKCAGGTSNGGTYLDLGARAHLPVVAGAWRDVQATVQNRPDGTVALAAYVGGRLVTSAIDDGVGCAPLRAAGAVGVRGDNTDLRVDDFEVRPV
jgi:hypothetical protein